MTLPLARDGHDFGARRELGFAIVYHMCAKKVKKEEGFSHL